MNNTQIIKMLNSPIYKTLPKNKNITFKGLIRELIDFIDGLRMRHYMVLTINKELVGTNDDDEEMDGLNHELKELKKAGFGDGEQLWIDNFTSIVEDSTEDDLFIMLNILGILNLGQPGEEILVAKNINNDNINKINDNNANYI
jgi:hypothetical protein